LRLLLAEDSPRLIELLQERVHAAGWRLDAFSSMANAYEAIKSDDYDLLLIDLGLPDGDGIELIKTIRASGKTVPIIIVSARDTIEDRVAGLDAGADDYLIKPFNHLEFLARCRALLRRGQNSSLPVLTVGLLSYDPATTEIALDGNILNLTPRERALLEILMRESGRVVKKHRLEVAMSEFGAEITANAIEVMISRTRKKLEEYSTSAEIITVRGIGYMLRDNDLRSVT
jgi:two-component system, OmpR family, response regulator